MDAIFTNAVCNMNWRLKEILENFQRSAPDESMGEGRDAALEYLESLCNGGEVQEERFLWNNPEGDGKEMYLVYPVLLSIVLEEYQYTERLMNLGYMVQDWGENPQIFFREVQSTGKRKGEQSFESDYFEINISQILLAKDNIPDALLQRIYDELCCICPVFSFGEDFWNNPFLYHSPQNLVRHSLPAMYGLDNIYQKHPEWLEGMLADLDTSFGANNANYLSGGLRNKLMRKLLKYFAGMGEDLVKYIEVFMPGIGSLRTDEVIKEQTKIWMKLLPTLQKACSMDKVSEKAFWESLVTLLGDLAKSKQLFNASTRERYFNELTEAARNSIPEDYGVEEYLEYVSKKDSNDYAYFLKLWKQITRKPVILDRMGATLWDMLRTTFGDTSKFSRDYRENNRDTRLFNAISMMEVIDEAVPVEEAEGEYTDILTELVCNLLDYNSEELFLACLKNKLVPEGAIPACVSSALKFDKLSIVPVLIMYQNRA